MQLIIDTSSEFSLIALVVSGKVATAIIRPHANQLSSTLLPDIQSLVTVQQLTSIAIGIGPGSYTGTRVGVAVAKALSFALNIPLIPFCSLLAFLPDVQGTFACAMPSRTQDYYLLKGTSTEERLTIELSGLVSSAELLEHLRGVDTVVRDLTPSFDSLLKWLNNYDLTTYAENPPQTDLIYLHSP